MSEVKVKFLRPVTVNRTKHMLGTTGHIDEKMAINLYAIKNPPVIEILSNVSWAANA